MSQETNKPGAGTGTVTGADSGVYLNGTVVRLGGQLLENVEITNIVASGANIGYSLRIYTADFGGFGAFIGVIPDPFDSTNPVNIAGFQTYGPDSSYMTHGASGNAIITKGANTGIPDYSSSVSGADTADGDSYSRQQIYSTGGTEYQNITHNWYRNSERTQDYFYDAILGIETTYDRYHNRLQDTFNGVDARQVFYYPGENLFIHKLGGTRNSTGAAQNFYDRGSQGAAWTQRQEYLLGDETTNDMGEYYRSQRRISIYDTNPYTGDPMYTWQYDSGTNIGWGTYQIDTLQNIARTSTWDNVIRIDVGVLISNSEGEFGQTDYIEIVLPACSSQYDFGREFTLDILPTTDVNNIAYQRYIVIKASDGSTIGGLPEYLVSANQKLSITLKGGNNPTQYEIIEGMSTTRYAGRMVTFLENFRSQNGLGLPLLGEVTGNQFNYVLPRNFFQVDGDRIYGKFFFVFAAGNDPKLIDMQFDGGSASPSKIGISTNPVNELNGCVEFEFIRVSDNNMYCDVVFSTSDSSAVFDNIAHTSGNISGPMNYSKAISLATDTASGLAGDIILKKGSFINFEPGIISL